MTLFTFENIEESHQHRMFRLLDVDYFATLRLWVNLPLTAILGIVVALIFAPTSQLLSQSFVRIGYGLLIVTASFYHGLGHIISSRIANAPMKSLLMTATVNVTHYEDHQAKASRVHISRSIGGPVFNLLLGLIGISIYVLALRSHSFLFFGSVNLVFGAFTLLPIPSLDGSVILRELRDWR